MPRKKAQPLAEATPFPMGAAIQTKDGELRGHVVGHAIAGDLIEVFITDRKGAVHRLNINDVEETPP